MDELAELIDQIITTEPMERRLYPDLYAQKVADALRDAGYSKTA